MSDDSDIQNRTGQRRKRPLNPASSSESSNSGSTLVTSKCTKQLICDSDDDTSVSENEEIIAVRPGRKRETPKILSDYETGESNHENGDLLTDSSGSSSEDENDPKSQSAPEKSNLDCLVCESSSDFDGQSEKCPICLAKFSGQEIGTPEACDHYFCAACIQEWSKNVNTCPVDRQPFTLILVRQQLEGKVIRQIPVCVPVDTVEVPEDATFCEVCGLSDREDRMLLCDVCDHGYHMECLNPPLDQVPIDEWYCPECAPHRPTTHRSTRMNRGLRTEVEPASEGNENQARDRPRPRMVPRTRHSERVRTTLRNRRVINAPSGHQLTSSGVDSMEGDGNPVSRRPRTRRNRVKRRRPRIRIKQILTDDGVIEVVLKRKSRRNYKKKRKNRTVRSAPRSVKGRLANKLGMCKPRMTNQMIPETLNRQELANAPMNHQRHQAGIPTLDIFGRREQLDYFSGTDEEDGVESLEGGLGVLRARVARPNDHVIKRKKAASVLSSNSIRKPLKVETMTSPASGNLLDSILDSQTLWHSKKVEIKSKSDGSLHVVLPKDSNRGILKEDKIDVRNTVAPVVETPLFPGGRGNSGAYKPDNANKGGTGNTQSMNRSHSEQAESSNYQSSGSGGMGYSRYENPVGPTPLRGVAPIRFRMNIPPRRPNIHSYPTDNIPPPPPLRLRQAAVEMSFPSTNSSESSPTREEEEIDIYSDIEQESNANENDTEEKSFGVLEPPPEPPFLMTMEPPPEPPAMLMSLNDDASDDEPSGLVIDDPPQGDVYDPCAVNSDDSSAEDTPLSKPPEVPVTLKNPDLVADYSSNSCPNTETPPYNPELPTYLSTPIIGPLPRPASHNSEAEDSDGECPNFSMYSAASMNLAHRGFPLPIPNLDIPIPPTVEEDPMQNENFDDIPLPDADSPKSVEEDTLDIPIPQEAEKEGLTVTEGSDKLTKDSINHSEDSRDSINIPETSTEVIKDDFQTEEFEKNSVQSDGDEEEDDQDDSDDEEDGEEADDDQNADDESEGDHSVQDESEKGIKSKIVKSKGSSEAGEDECSTQGDVLDLAIESEANLENNIQHDDNEEQNGINLAKSPIEFEESGEKVIDSGDKSDGLVDITDEEMSVYDGQDNDNDLEKLNEQVLEEMQHRKNENKSLDSDDDNSLVGGATSAVSAGTLNNSDNIHPPALPGLEGLETETISESEDVNFDELPMEGSEQQEILINDEDLISSRRKRKKKYRKMSHTEDGKGSNEPLEFEEGEIIEDKPKQVAKKDKKIKLTPDNEIKVDESVETNKPKASLVEKEPVEKRTKKKKDKSSTTKDKNEKGKEPREKTLKPGEVDENISWKKLSKSNKERNYRDGKEKDEKEKDRENKDEGLSKKEKRNKEKRKELERYNVRRLISEKPKRPKKDEFGRDISPSKSGSSLSPYRPPRYRSPLRTRNRSRTRSRSWKSRSRSRGRRRQSRSRERPRSHERLRRSRSRERSRKRSRSRNKVDNRSRERRKTPDKADRNDKVRIGNRSLSRNRKKSHSRSPHTRRQRSASYSRSWTASWSKSSVSRSQSRGRRKSRTRTKSRSWTREQNVTSLRSARKKDPPKNLTVIVTNKDALKKKDKKKPSKRKDDRRKKKRGQSPAPSKEVFTSGDNILVSVNFKNANKNPELIPASTPLLRESSKRKRDDTDSSAKKKKPSSSSKKLPGVKKSNRLAKINEVTRNAKPVAIIDLDLSPFREQTPSPKEVIVLSDSGDEGDKQHSEVQEEINRLGHSAITQSMLSLSSIDHGQKNSMSQPESPLSSSFLLNSSGPKTPPEPHIKFSISTKPSQIRMLTNPLMETEEEMQDENIENDDDEILHKGPNTPPEPPPDLNTPASPPTTPYDPFDPTKSRSPSPQPRSNETGQQLNTSREDKLDNLQNDDTDHPRLAELRTSTPPNETDDIKKTPESAKIHSTPKVDPNNPDTSPKVSPPTGISEGNKICDDTLMKPIQKLLVGANKLDVTVHKSPEKLITVVISQQVKNLNQTPKQTSQPLKTITPNKHLTPKSSAKHQLFSNSLLKQVPILGTLPLLPGPPIYTPSMSLNSNSKAGSRLQQNGDPSDDMDIDPSSPYSPGSSEGDDLFEPPMATPPRSSSKPASKSKPSSGNKFDALFGSSPAKPRHGRHASKTAKKGLKSKSKGNKKEEVKVKLDEDQLKILDELPSSAVEMQFLKKLNRQERVVEEVKLVLKPHYAKKHINKEDYKEILRRAVPKICHNKSGEINPIKIQFLIEAYVKKFRYAKKKASGAVSSAPVQIKPKPQKNFVELKSG
uniref:PHD and RING finger domain-containing protein 1 n=1 Tax=Graphocephala atropunctata TaxID=36148 RepID=A0A1B6MT05_9HEMI